MIACVAAFPAAADAIRFNAPDAGKGASFSIYLADDPTGLPVATGGAGETVDLPPGSYVVGVDSYPWRSEAVATQGGGRHELDLGALVVAAPDDAVARFGLFDNDSGQLVAPATVGDVIYVPQGRYRLRRDIATWFTDFEIDALRTVTLNLGAVRFDGAALPSGQSVYIADLTASDIVAVTDNFAAAVALPDGRYLLAASSGVPPVEISVSEGQITPVSGRQVIWADMMPESGDMALEIGGERFDLAAGSPANLIVFDTESAGVIVGETTLGSIELSTEQPTLLWRLEDGRIPNFEGLPLELDADGPQVLPRGATMRLVGTVAQRSEIRTILYQGGEAFEIGLFTMNPGRTTLEFTVPMDLDEENTAYFEISVVGNPKMTGRSVDYAVHRELSEPVASFTVAGVTATSVALSWAIPDAQSAVGVMLFRGADAKPINGSVPLSGSEYVDIGLSAGRNYTYRICPMDDLRYLGPCAEIEATTQNP